MSLLTPHLCDLSTLAAPFPYHQTIDWLQETFLCLESGRPNGDRAAFGKPTALEKDLQSTFGSATGDFELILLDMRRTLDNVSRMQTHESFFAKIRSEDEVLRLGEQVRFACENGKLEIETASSDLLGHLVRSLVIDRLKIDPKRSELGEHEVLEVDLSVMLRELDGLIENSDQLEESEKRIQTELYEAAQFTKSLLQQLAIAYELNEL